MTMDDVVVDNETIVKTEIKKPKRYAVILINDDYTPMNFVVSILIKIFQKSVDESRIIMEKVHHEGKAVVDLYSKEVAEQKVYETMDVADKHGHPLLAITEEQFE